MKENLGGDKPKELSADNGYFSEDNVTLAEKEKTEPFIATGRQKHGEKVLPVRGRTPKDATIKELMARKLRTLRGRGAYKKRKEIVEPVFGQITWARGFWQFLLRGLRNVGAEWDLICLTHNLLKLHRGGWHAQAARKDTGETVFCPRHEEKTPRREKKTSCLLVEFLSGSKSPSEKRGIPTGSSESFRESGR